ncbi:MAG: hypothetical protein KF815_03870 [Rhodospirillales bacterium]|nr:hypothetical protein [Rhodospirillales bacterium]
MTQVVRKPLLTIPSETEGSAAFKARLAALIKDEQTHIYIDTSFLMWMTKIGSNSRQELLSWLESNCSGRAHVPIWAAHEYLKHHVAGTIITELAEKTDEVAALVGQTYTYFRPFIDEPFGEGAEDPSTIRATTRNALDALKRLASISRQWHKSYQKHAAEVIAFINEATPEKTFIYDYFSDLSGLGAGRFVGSIPPGFQDRRKKGSSPQTKAADDEAPADSNRFGDLVFWKELLEHAREMKAQAILILTNDRKSDWHMGRSEAVNVEPALLALKKSWKPVPRAHPIFTLEAKLVAGVHRVELLDSPYLAVLLRDFAEDKVRAFADVAIIPDGPETETESERRAKIYEKRIATDAAKLVAAVTGKGYLFADAPEVRNSRAILSRALYNSRTAVSERSQALLDGWRASVETKRSLSEAITSETFEGFDQNDLVQLSRELHDRVLQGTPGYGEAVADLASILDRLPLNTAASLYLGLLASMYLVRTTNTSRLPPASPVAQLLFERQGADYAQHGVGAVAKRLLDNDFAPLYVPSVDLPPVAISLDIEPKTSALDQLRSIKVQDVELLTPAQSDEALKLSALFGTEAPVDGVAIVLKACELFAIPINQVERQELLGNVYNLTKTIGFKRPVDISIPKERPHGE